MWVGGNACVYFIRVFARRVSKANAISYEKKPSLPAPGKTSRSRLYMYIHILTDTHARTNHTRSLSLSLSPSFSLSHYNIYIYITLYFRTQKWTVCGWQSSSVICVRVGSEHVCVCMFAPAVWLCYKNDVFMCMCVCFGIKRVYHRLVETPYAAGDMSLSAFHSTSPNHTSSQINNGLPSYVFLVLYYCMCV